MPRRKKSILDKIEVMQDIEAIQSLVKEMKPLLLKAKIKESAIKNVFNIEPSRHKELKHYLIELYMREYTLYMRTYNTLPPHAWDHYELVGITHMPEQAQLNENAKALAKAWKNRPKKKKSTPKEVTND